MLVVSAPTELIRERLAQRTQDPSDATFEIYEAARARWSAIDDALCQFDRVDASGTTAQMVTDATRALARVGLA
jgi:predicted kinase